ncbi:DUF4177 domain-containing protein [Celeribacter litoreus]|uniref:DUF4177 domain-containing protein n=1 Tax=Celeribacter litoreus TaxID=2876714 RepID=UPI001CCCBD7B|nr:DUF4177 domain-containing protein [Celeribacter litoreus]MCA0043110.1 DUF4177 domain-containing protein [Celeribacter litoreus]
MPLYEYLTIPAPRKGEKAKGVKSAEGRIAQAMTTLLNEKAADGWEYLRADLVPMEERSGITSKTVNYHTILVFRREAGIAPAVPETTEVEAAPKPLSASRSVPEASAPFPSVVEDGAGAKARAVAPDVADEIAEDRES